MSQVNCSFCGNGISGSSKAFLDNYGRACCGSCNVTELATKFVRCDICHQIVPNDGACRFRPSNQDTYCPKCVSKYEDHFWQDKDEDEVTEDEDATEDEGELTEDENEFENM